MEAVKELEEEELLAVDSWMEGEPDIDAPPGAADINISIKCKLSDFQMLELSIGLNEPYSGRNADTRENKVEELYAYVENKIQDKLKELVPRTRKLLKDLS